MKVTVTFRPFDQKLRPINYILHLSKTTTVLEFKAKVQDATRVEQERLVIAGRMHVCTCVCSDVFAASPQSI